MRPKLLLINPNTSPAITDLAVGHARRVAGGRAEITGVTGRFGARYIASRAASCIAGHAALDAWAEHSEGHDAVLLACFGDPGLLALREMSTVPVLGMADAACREAATGGRRFSIVTGGPRWEPMLREFMDVLGLRPSLASIRTVAPSGGEIARDPDRALDLLAEACAAAAREDGAEAVVLGGAGLAGIRDRIADRVPVPLVCSLEASVEATIAAVEAARPGAAAASPADVPGSVGLTPALAERMDARGL